MEWLNKNQTTQKWKKDLLLWLLLATAGGILAMLIWQARPAAAAVDVRVGGKVQASYPLAEDRVVTVTGVGGGTNELHIEHGSAWLKEASCPDKLCVKQGKIHRDGESIICLPNQVVIELRDGTRKGGDLDGIAG